MALTWQRRDGLSESDRGLAREVRELAHLLSHRPFPHQEDLKSLHILGCHLCRRVGDVKCEEQQYNCALGFAEAH
jgi:hypothetical protein